MHDINAHCTIYTIMSIYTNATCVHKQSNAIDRVQIIVCNGEVTIKEYKYFYFYFYFFYFY